MHIIAMNMFDSVAKLVKNKGSLAIGTPCMKYTAWPTTPLTVTQD